MTDTAPRVVVVIQARMGSTRLHGKVLEPLLGRPVLDWVVRAAKKADGVDNVVIATSETSNDDRIDDFGASLGVQVVRGSEDDVLSRFLLVANRTRADAVVRLTADCPLLDPVLISAVVAIWRRTPDVDYVSTTHPRSLPRGLDVELVTTKALHRADRRTEKYHRAHVTSAVYEDGAEFTCASLSFLPRNDRYRVTLDTHEDLKLLCALTKLLGDAPPSWREVVRTLDAHPEIVELNAHIEQKALREG
ncbi:cytidylyltransferase domain-containing protein [Arthrobacter roseus]|uniref:cytidylyltransferase domain-containing protein n=1 Tax=Arthrobacter roseus TaxID=136274 RepID=UPI00196269F6|nr:glycosyltransferase family protein [Arthrobacter roseus]MBM7849086.1 spore coat polysaccharide biosynthesis protein SpsF [Arthrobacter roseus]